MARNEPTLDQALVVVIDAITSLSPARRACLRALLDLVAQHPDMGDDVLDELRHLLARRHVPPRLRVIADGSQVAAPCRPTLRGVPPTLKVVQGGRAPS